MKTPLANLRFLARGQYLPSVRTMRLFESGIATPRVERYWAESFSSCAWSPDGHIPLTPDL